MMVWPTAPGVKSPSESIVPELADQVIGSLIGLPELSFTTAVNRIAWSALTVC